MGKKVIHYCWFGRNQFPILAKKCMQSWKKFFPDYQIIEWNETNLNLEINQYVKEAYKVKKWAFVSDYFRFWILYQYGGMYFDTDVEVIRDFSPLLNENQAICGFESKYGVNPGLILYSACSRNSIFKEVLESYRTDKFILPNRIFNEKTIVVRFTDILRTHGLKLNGEKQTIGKLSVFPKEYFCPLAHPSRKLTLTNHTYTIHHFQGSWVSEEKQHEQKIYQDYYKKINPILGKYLGDYLARCIKVYKCRGGKRLVKAIFENIQYIYFKY